jgi:hypothetical protein
MFKHNIPFRMAFFSVVFEVIGEMSPVLDLKATFGSRGPVSMPLPIDLAQETW